MRTAPYSRTVERRKIGMWQASHRYTRPTFFGRYSCNSSKRGTAFTVRWATAWQWGHVTTRFLSWSWCNWLAESMYRDMGPMRAARCFCAPPSHHVNCKAWPERVVTRYVTGRGERAKARIHSASVAYSPLK